MFALRDTYVPSIVRGAGASPIVAVGAVTVEGTDLGDFGYKDDFGSLWKYEIRSGLPAGQIRASTDQYGGQSTPWFDRPIIGDGHDQVITWVDTNAASLAVAFATTDSEKPSGDGGGEIFVPATDHPFGEPSKKSGGGGSGMTSKPSGDGSGPGAQAPPSGSNGMLIIILGMLGAGLLVWKLVGA